MIEKNIKLDMLKNLNYKSIGILFLMFIFATVFWDSLLIYPIKLFVVLLHEMSHGIAAILTGGRIDCIKIDMNIGGVCYFSGGNAFITASAGYLGSIFWGGLILIIASRTRYSNIMGMVIGALLFLISIFYVRNLFGFLFTVLFGVVLFTLSYKLNSRIMEFFMKFIGLTSCLYVIIDIKEDLIARTNIGSDADAIANALWCQGLSIPIGIIWILIAFTVFIFSLLIASKKNEHKN